MDEQTITTPIQPAPMEQMPAQKTSYHKKKHLLLIITIILLIVIIAGGAFLIIHHQKKVQLNPQAGLQQLDDSSQPVKAPVQQRAAALSEMDKSSVQYIVTPQQKLNTLNVLK